MHYNGNKNSSVFRKALGGALMRELDPENPCLLPALGQGHWEKQDMHTCEKCKPFENQVSELLKSSFYFRCIEIENRDLRNSFEEKLVATVSLCPVCKPSSSWLGRHAYSDKVRRSGLWNSDFVFDQTNILSNEKLKTFKTVVEKTSAHF